MSVQTDAQITKAIYDLVREHGPAHYPSTVPRDLIADLLSDGSEFNSAKRFEQRYAFTNRYTWALPTWGVISKIAAFVGDARVLEVAAGSGLWAALLKAQGVDIVATDRQPWQQERVIDGKQFTGAYPWDGYLDVKRQYALSAVKQYRDCDALMLCWPTYDTSLAYRATREFRGSKLIYVGESDGGCTGDDDFHALLRDKWELVRAHRVCQWSYLHDALYLYQRMGAEGGRRRRNQQKQEGAAELTQQGHWQIQASSAAYGS